MMIQEHSSCLLVSTTVAAACGAIGPYKLWHFVHWCRGQCLLLVSWKGAGSSCHSAVIPASTQYCKNAQVEIVCQSNSPVWIRAIQGCRHTMGFPWLYPCAIALFEGGSKFEFRCLGQVAHIGAIVAVCLHTGVWTWWILKVPSSPIFLWFYYISYAPVLFSSFPLHSWKLETFLN